MDPLKHRNAYINNELNKEYDELAREINVRSKYYFLSYEIINFFFYSQNVVESGFQELLGKFKRLHISNIPFSFREADLIALFRVIRLFNYAHI